MTRPFLLPPTSLEFLESAAPLKFEFIDIAPNSFMALVIGSSSWSIFKFPSLRC